MRMVYDNVRNIPRFQEAKTRMHVGETGVHEVRRDETEGDGMSESKVDTIIGNGPVGSCWCLGKFRGAWTC